MKGDTWAGTSRDLNHLSPKDHTFTHYLTRDYVSDAIKANRPPLPSHYYNGVARFNVEHKPIDHGQTGPDGLSSNFVTTLFEDNQSNIWAGYKSTGLSRWNRDQRSFTI